MKRITSILAVMALSSAAYAADTVDMKWNAEMRTRYTSENAKGGIKSETGNRANTFNTFEQRNKLGLQLSKGESFQGHLSLINGFNWGSVSDRTASGYNPGVQGATAGNLLIVNEAYGWWKANDMASVKFGRATFDIAGGYVSSSNDWQAVPYSWDGIWTMWDFEPVNLNVFGTKSKDANVAGAFLGASGNQGQSDAESVMYGAIVGFKTLPEAIKKAEIHLLQMNDEVTDLTGTAGNGDGSFRTELMRYGLFLNGDMNNFNYHAAADMYQGKFKAFSGGSSTDFDLTGSMFDIGVGYTMPEMMMMHFGLDYHMDSGGDTMNTSNKANKTYAPGQYHRDVSGTFMDAVAWGNLTFFRLNFGLKPQEDLGVDLYLSKFSRTNDKDTVNVYGDSSSGVVANTSSNDIGQEIDLVLTKSYGDNFSIWALYGMFQPGDMLKNDNRFNGATDTTNKEDQHTRIQIQGKLTF